MPKKKVAKRKSAPRVKKQKNIFLKFIGGIVGLLAVLTIAMVVTSFNQSPVSKIASTTDLGTFSGVLPCADCSGIQTTITFNLSADEKIPNTYTETDSYTGKNVINSTTGTWQYTTNPNNPEAVIIELTQSDQPLAKQYFMVVNDTTIQMLDQEKNPITDAPMPMVLTKSK